MAVSFEDVIVRVQAVTRGFQQKMNSARQSANMLNNNLQGMGHVLSMNTEDLRNNAGFIRRNEAALGRMTLGVRDATHGMKGFRMELLGVMFFGMMLKTAMFGLLRPVMEVFGVFDLFRAMLQILFLPVMEMLFPLFLQMFEFFTNLPQPVQKAIGLFVVVAGILGTLIFLIGAIGLGLGSMFMTFTGTFATIPQILRMVVKAIGALFSGLGLAIVGVAIGIFVAWKENFMNIRAWMQVWIQGVKEIFMGIVDIFRGVFNIIMGIVTGDFQRIIDGVKSIFNGMISIISGQFKAALSGIQIIFTGIARIVKGIFDTVVGIVKKANELSGGALGKIASGIGGAASSVGGFLGRINPFNDFIMRPGSSPVAFSPQDTIVGFKGSSPFGGNNVNITQNINVTASNKSEIERIISENNKRLVDDIRRIANRS